MFRSKTLRYRGVIANIGERSGWVVTTPIGYYLTREDKPRA